MALLKSLICLLVFLSCSYANNLRQFAKSPLSRKLFLNDTSIEYYFSDQYECTQNAPGAPAGIPVRDDTIGRLISSQGFWRLPGLDGLSHGFNIFTGKEEINPIFQFCYPDDSVQASRIQDTYRGNVYLLPEQIFADALPQCTFSMTSAMYSSSTEMAEAMQHASSLDVSAGGGFNGFGISVAMSYAYHEEKSVSQAFAMQSRHGGSVSSTSVQCLTSRIQLADQITSFHPAFAWDLYKVLDQADMVDVIDKYGTHYYEYAELGGKLSQVTSISSEYASKATSSEMSQHLEESFSASAGGWGVSVEGSGGSSESSSEEQSRKEEFEQSATSSYIMSYGGAPGTFGPGGDSNNANWGSWAQTIDLLPIPINYKLRRIGDIIPSTWKTETGTEAGNVLKLWNLAENEYLQYKAAQIVRRQLGADNLYRIRVTMNNSDAVALGPYAFRINTGDNYQMGLTFFARNLPMNETTAGLPHEGAGAPFAFQPYLFKQSDNFVMEYRQDYSEERPESLTLCPMKAVTNVTIGSAAAGLKYWNVESIIIEDVVQSTLYPILNFTALYNLKDEECATLKFGTLPNTIKVTFKLPAPVVKPETIVYLLFEFKGIIGTLDIYQEFSLIEGKSADTDISFEQTYGQSIGYIQSCRIRVAVDPSADKTSEKWSFTMRGSSFRVEATENNKRNIYKGGSAGNLLAGIGIISNNKLSMTGIDPTALDPPPSDSLGKRKRRGLKHTWRPLSVTLDGQ